MKGMVAVEDPASTGRTPGELDGGLGRFGTRVAKGHPLDPGVGPAHQGLGQQSRQDSAVELHQIWEICIQRLMEGVLDDRVAPAQCVDAESRQEIEITVALVVDEIRPLPPHIMTIEANGAEDLDELRVQKPGMQVEAVTSITPQHRVQIERHHHTPILRLTLRSGTWGGAAMDTRVRSMDAMATAKVMASWRHGGRNQILPPLASGHRCLLFGVLGVCRPEGPH